MMNYRMQRDYDRAQRRAFRNQRRGFFGGFGGIIWLIVILSVISSHWFWVIVPLVLLGIPLFLWIMRAASPNNMSGAMNQQPYSQPQYQQPDLQDQSYAQPQYQQPAYQPYSQGYAAQQPASRPHESYQENGQTFQYEAEQPQTQQYEEPLTMYPQE